MKIVRKLLTPDEISNPNVRWNPDTDAVETTFDGGTTWTPNPASDPRYSPAFQAPPIVSDNPPCDASARMTASLQGVLNTFLVDVALTTAATSTAAYLIALTGPIGWLFDLIIVVSDVLITIGSAAISTAFTTDVWDGIQQIIYCAMSPDGTLTQAATVDILAQIDALYPGTVADTIHKLIQLYGNVLLNNAAYERTETGDCSGFACAWCYEWNFRINDGGFVNWDGRGEYVPGEGWKTTIGAGFVAATISRLCDDGVCDVTVDEFSALIDYVTLPATGYNAFWYRTGSGDGSYNNIGYGSLDVPPGEATYTYTDTSLDVYPNIGVNAVVNDEDGVAYIRTYRASGHGVMPDFVGGTDCS